MRLELAWAVDKGLKTMGAEKSQKKKRGLDWILWWRIDPEELSRQVTEYHSLGLMKSARGISFLLLIFSAAVTVGMINLFGQDPVGYVDVGLMLGLGIMILVGHRWAIVLTMMLWTVEKIFQIYLPLSGGTNVNVIVPIIWWALYMHAFYLALKVENARRHTPLSGPSTSPASTPPTGTV